MKFDTINLGLTGYDDLFMSSEERADRKKPKVEEIAISELRPFKDHPFRVKEDEEMEQLKKSIHESGVLVPALARPTEDGYELISGHRRKMASTLAGRDSLPCIVRDLSDDEAIIVMVDSNLQREQLLPSEKAKAYKMKLEAMRRQAGRPSKENVSQVETHLRTSEVIAQQAGESRAQVDRFIRLNNLVPEIMALVDEGKIGMTPAVELSYIPQEQQALVMEAIDSEQATPSLSQAQRLRKMSTAGELNEDTALEVMMEQKKPPQSEKSPLKGGITISEDRLKTIFPQTWDRVRMEKLIYSLLETWARHREERNKGPER